MREGPLEAWAVSYARFRGIVVAKLKECDGIPDRIFFMPGGHPIVVEFKQQGKRGKDLQAETQPWYIKTLAAAGYTVCYCETKDQFRELMKRHECSKTRKLKS